MFTLTYFRGGQRGEWKSLQGTLPTTKSVDITQPARPGFVNPLGDGLVFPQCKCSLWILHDFSITGHPRGWINVLFLFLGHWPVGTYKPTWWSRLRSAWKSRVWSLIWVISLCTGRMKWIFHDEKGKMDQITCYESINAFSYWEQRYTTFLTHLWSLVWLSPPCTCPITCYFLREGNALVNAKAVLLTASLSSDPIEYLEITVRFEYISSSECLFVGRTHT